MRLPLISGANDAARRDLVEHALSLGKTLSRTLQPAMLHDDMWQAYEVITTPFDSPRQQRGQPIIVVVELKAQFMSRPIPSDFRRRSRWRASARWPQSCPRYLSGPARLRQYWKNLDPALTIMTVPLLSNDNTRLGTVVMEYPSDMYRGRFLETVARPPCRLPSCS